MGVDCKVTLSPGTRIEDAATVIGAALGCKKVWVTTDGGSRWVNVNGAMVRPCSISGCGDIYVSAPTEQRRFLWHYEWGADGSRGMILRSTAVNIALARRLAEFFGGSVAPNDSDEDFAWEWPYRADCRADDDEEWDVFQQRLMGVDPILVVEIEACRDFAAYDEES